jgi:hypothetical protein
VIPVSEEIACGKPTGAVLGEEKSKTPIEPEMRMKSKEVKKPMVAVGKKAPDFEAPAFYQGKFTNIKLSDYLKKWVVLCFYPGDFTFV